MNKEEIKIPSHNMFMAGGNTQSEKEFYQLGYSAAMQEKQSNDVQQAAKEYPGELCGLSEQEWQLEKVVDEIKAKTTLEGIGILRMFARICEEEYSAGASFNSDAVEFAEWCNLSYTQIGVGLWYQSMLELGPDRPQYTTQELYNLFLADKNDAQEANADDMEVGFY